MGVAPGLDGDAAAEPASRAGLWVLLVASLATGVVFLDSTVVNLALPAIGRDLPRISVSVLEGQAFIYVGYLLSLSSLLILAGAITDRFGRRRILGLGLSGFGVTSLLCGLAPSMETLIGLRILQGAAGAFLVPASLALISAGFKREARGRAIGIWTAAGTATTLLGPVVGGLLVDLVSWRAIFLINVPLVAIAGGALLARVPESHDQTSVAGFDWLGAAVTALGTGGLVFGVIRGQQSQWHDPVAVAGLVLGLAAASSFIPLMAVRPHPLVPLHLFRSRVFAATNASTLLIYGGLYTYLYTIQLFLQGTLGYTASAAAVVGLPAGIMLVFGSARMGAWAGRLGPRWFMTLGPLVMALGMLMLLNTNPGTEAWRLQPGNPSSLRPPLTTWTQVVPGLLMLGAGATIMVAPLTTALMASVPVANSGLASAINNAISRIGPQFAQAAIFVGMTSVFFGSLAGRLGAPAAAELRHQLSPLTVPPGLDPTLHGAVRAASIDAFHLAAIMCALLFGAGALVNAVFIPSGPVRPPDPDPGLRLRAPAPATDRAAWPGSPTGSRRCRRRS